MIQLLFDSYSINQKNHSNDKKSYGNSLELLFVEPKNQVVSQGHVCDKHLAARVWGKILSKDYNFVPPSYLFLFVFCVILVHPLLLCVLFPTIEFLSIDRMSRPYISPQVESEFHNSMVHITPFYQHIGGIRMLGSSMGHIQITITHLIFVEKIQNLYLNSSLGCLLSKRFKPRLRIPFHSKYCQNGEQMLLFSTFSKRLSLVNNQLLTYILLMI